MTDVRVCLEGEEACLSHLPKIWRSADLCVEEDAGRYYMRSSAFNALGAPDEVYTEAVKLTRRVSGAATIFFGKYIPIRAGAVQFKDDQGESQSIVFVSCECHITSLSYAELTVSGEDATQASLKPTFVEAWFSLAERDPKAAVVLEIIGSGQQDWYRLWKVYESIRDDVGSEKKLSGTGWVTKQEISLFGHTANFAEDDAARHATGIKPPPTTPMTLRKARGWVMRLARRWLDYKVQQANP